MVVGLFASQGLVTFLSASCFAENRGDLRRLWLFLAEISNKYCGDFRRRRTQATTAQKQLKILAREVPSSKGLLVTLTLPQALKRIASGLQVVLSSAPVERILGPTGTQSFSCQQL